MDGSDLHMRENWRGQTGEDLVPSPNDVIE
jgi:hypothetical protein